MLSSSSDLVCHQHYILRCLNSALKSITTNNNINDNINNDNINNNNINNNNINNINNYALYTTMNRLLLSILALAVTAQACVRIAGTCQTGSIQPGVHIDIDDNNGQAVCDTSCNTGHGNFVVDISPALARRAIGSAAILPERAVSLHRITLWIRRLWVVESCVSW
ncbi:hypothetical protein V8C34DRAFT_266708 [Trichoderma compactum]